MTVREWIEHHIEHLTGLRKSTLWDYESYLRKDIGPALGELPLTGLTREHIAKWTQDLADARASGKTISNKHGVLFVGPERRRPRQRDGATPLRRFEDVDG